MKIPKNSVEILLFIFLVVVGYIYEGLSGVFIGGILAIILIIRTKLRENIKKSGKNEQ